MRFKLLGRMSLVIVLAMMCSIALCAGRSDKTDATAKELPEYRIKYLKEGIAIPFTMSDESTIGKVIKDKFNIVFEFIPYAGDWAEKQNLMLASGDYLELMSVEWDDNVKKYINAGAVLPLDDLIEEYGPDFKDRYKDIMPIWRAVSDDGKLYKFESGTFNDMGKGPGLDMLVRTDILEAFGWPELKTDEEYLDFVAKALAKFPETNGNKTIGMVAPLAESWGIAALPYILFSKGKYTEYAGNKVGIWDNEKGKYTDYVKNPYSKQSVYFFNKAYRLGVLDRECFTTYCAQVDEKLNVGRPVTAFYQTWTRDSANANLKEQGHPEMQYITMPIMLQEQWDNKDKRMIGVLPNNAFNSKLITKNAKHPERIMQLINWVATEEGQITLGWGIEGVHYKIVDGLRVLTDDFLAKYLEDPKILGIEGLEQFHFLGVTLAVDSNKQPYTMRYSQSFRNATTDQRLFEAYENLGWESESDPWKGRYLEPERIDVGLIQNSANIPQDYPDEQRLEERITQLRVDYTAKLITAESDEEFEAIWDEFIKKHDALGPQKILDIYNKNMEKAKAIFK